MAGENPNAEKMRKTDKKNAASNAKGPKAFAAAMKGKKKAKGKKKK